MTTHDIGTALLVIGVGGILLFGIGLLVWEVWEIAASGNVRTAAGMVGFLLLVGCVLAGVVLAR